MLRNGRSSILLPTQSRGFYLCCLSYHHLIVYYFSQDCSKSAGFTECGHKALPFCVGYSSNACPLVGWRTKSLLVISKPLRMSELRFICQNTDVLLWFVFSAFKIFLAPILMEKMLLLLSHITAGLLPLHISSAFCSLSSLYFSGSWSFSSHATAGIHSD